MKPVSYTHRRAVSEAIPSCGLSMSQGIPTGMSSHWGPGGYGQGAYLGHGIRYCFNTVSILQTHQMDTVKFAHEGKIWVPTERFDLLLYINNCCLKRHLIYNHLGMKCIFACYICLMYFVHLYFIDIFLIALKFSVLDDHFIYEDLKMDDSIALFSLNISDIDIPYHSSTFIYDTDGCKISNMK